MQSLKVAFIAKTGRAVSHKARGSTAFSDLIATNENINPEKST